MKPTGVTVTQNTGVNPRNQAAFPTKLQRPGVHRGPVS